MSIGYFQECKILFAKYNGKWIRLKEIIDKTMNRSTRIGFINIIRTLRTRNSKRYKTLDKIAKEEKTNQ